MIYTVLNDIYSIRFKLSDAVGETGLSFTPQRLFFLKSLILSSLEMSRFF